MKRRPCYVYAIISGSRHVKVGISVDPEARLRELQGGNQHRLYMLATWRFKSAQEAYAAEQSIHRRMRRHRTIGEWFRFGGDGNALAYFLHRELPSDTAIKNEHAPFWPLAHRAPRPEEYMPF